MNVPVYAWVLTIAVIIGLILFDFFGHVRKAHEPTIKEAAIWSSLYVALGLIFGVVVWQTWGNVYGTDYFNGFLTEKALSVDNLFVFLIIMTKFSVPRKYQQKVLLIGIVIALVMRTAFILVGVAAINRWSWVFYIFSIFLFYTAINMMKESLQHKDPDPDQYGESPFIRIMSKIFPQTDKYHDDRMLVKLDNKWTMTPMFIVILAIGTTDLLFALDSIPAIFGVISEPQPFIIFTANAFALLGLRQLYFLIGGLIERLVYLSHGLSILLAFIGVKLMLHALHENQLWFINGGEPVPVIEITPRMSLIGIGVIITVATVASLLKTRSDKKKSIEQ